MAEALYRKYRPTTWKDVVGQNHIKLTLQNEISGGRLSHAYLFTGPRGVGKTTIARLLAKSLNCESRKEGETEPCNTCSVCTEINSGSAIDLVEIDAASHTGVDNVRENIISNARVAPTRYPYKVFIIDEAHMLSPQAFNALLKTLEEPPKNVVFILATTEVHRLPQTIISRCQQFQFHTIVHDDLVKRLKKIAEAEEVSVDDDVLHSVAHHSGGYVRDAESMLSQIFALGEKEITMDQASLVLPRSDFSFVRDLYFALTREDAKASIELIGDLIEKGVELRQFTDDFLSFLRHMMLLSVNPSLENLASMDFSKEDQKKILNAAGDMSRKDLLTMIGHFREARTELSPKEHILQLPLELAVMKYIHRYGEQHAPPEEKREEATSPQSSEMPADSAKKGDPETVGKGANSESWQKVLEGVKEKNHSLYMTLKVGKMLGMRGQSLIVGFGYTFHCERLMEAKNKVVIDEVLTHVHGKTMTLGCTVDESVRQQNPEPEDAEGDAVMVDKALEAFGGEVLK